MGHSTGLYLPSGQMLQEVQIDRQMRPEADAKGLLCAQVLEGASSALMTTYGTSLLVRLSNSLTLLAYLHASLGGKMNEVPLTRSAKTSYMLMQVRALRSGPACAT